MPLFISVIPVPDQIPPLETAFRVIGKSFSQRDSWGVILASTSS